MSSNTEHITTKSAAGPRKLRRILREECERDVKRTLLVDLLKALAFDVKAAAGSFARVQEITGSYAVGGAVWANPGAVKHCKDGALQRFRSLLW